MLRSTSKKAVRNLEKYIISNYDPSSYDLPIETEFAAVARQIMGCFFNEFGKHKTNGTSYQERFVNWCSGLPTILDTCYYYNRSAVDDLGAILEETETEKARFTEADAARILSCLIYRELTKAIRKAYNFNIWDFEEV